VEEKGNESYVTQSEKRIVYFSVHTCVWPVAIAQGFYIDGGYSLLNMDGEVEGFDVDVDLGGIHAHAGYDFNAYFGIEGEIIFGVSDDSISLDADDVADLGVEDIPEDFESIDLSVELNTLYGIYARGIWPVSERFDVFGRIGLVQAEIEGSASYEGESISESVDDSGVAYGVGAAFDLTDNFYLRADYTRYDIGDTDTDGFVFGTGFRF